MKQLITKKIIIGLILLLSLAGNIWYFGTQFYNKKKTEDFNKGIIFVFQQAKEKGEVSLKLDDDLIILIKK